MDCSSAGCRTDAGDHVIVNGDRRAFFIGGDTVLLKIVNGTVADFDLGDAAASTLHEDARPALAAIQRWSQPKITNGDSVKLPRSILERNPDKVWRALGDAIVAAIDCQSRDGDVMCVCDQKSGGDGRRVEEAGGIRLHS